MALLAALAMVLAACTGGGRHEGGRHQPVQAATHPEDTNPTVSNPVSALKAFGSKDNPTRRVQVSISHPGVSYDLSADDHIQGYTFYDRGEGFQIFSENHDWPGSISIFAGKEGGTKVTRFTSPFGGLGEFSCSHPAGMQIIGDYLLVAVECSSFGGVYMYDLTSVYEHPASCCGTGKDKPPGNKKPVELISTTGGSSASSVGITNISGAFKYSADDPNWDGTGGIRYVMAVHHYGKSVTLYISKPGVSLAAAESTASPAEALDFQKLKSFATDRKYDSMALLRQPNDSIWMMGFTTEGISNNDYADLLQLTNIGSNHKVIFGYHAKPGNGLGYERWPFKTKHSSAGIYGVHFRWGPGLNIYGDDHLRLNVTEREWGTAPGRKVTVNWFFNWKEE